MSDQLSERRPWRAVEAQGAAVLLAALRSAPAPVVAWAPTEKGVSWNSTARADCDRGDRVRVRARGPGFVRARKPRDLLSLAQ